MKNGYNFIGIEMESENAYNLCKPRLDMIIDNKDENGIDCNRLLLKGYKFYELAPSLIETDTFGQPIISKEYDSNMLASAVALHEGFIYSPDENCYWKQAKNENNTYLFVTTNHVDSQIIESIKTELKGDEFLLIVCKSFDTNANCSKNITIKKIPQSLLKNCEFGIDNYNLNIINPPIYEDDEDE